MTTARLLATPERIAQEERAEPIAVAPAPRKPADPRSVALAVLAIIALVFALHWARTFFVSLLMGILIAYALNPVVVRRSWKSSDVRGAT